MEKVKKDGCVAVLYSPGYGAGWSTWIDDKYAKIMLFHPEIVKLVLNNEKDKITESFCRELLGLDKGAYICILGAEDLQVKWVEEGSNFEIEDYDGSESIHIIGNRDYNTA